MTYPLAGVWVDPHGQSTGVEIAYATGGGAIPTVYLDPYGLLTATMPYQISQRTAFYLPSAGTYNVNGQLITLEGTEVGTISLDINSITALSPADCGPGGTADDTAACLAAFGSGAKRVLLRVGSTYTISQTLNASSNQVIDARGATIIKKHGATNMNGLLRVGEGVTNVTVLGGIWDGDRFNDTMGNPNYQYSYYSGIRLQGCRDVWLKDCTVQNVYSHGIMMGDQVDKANVTCRINLIGCETRGCMDGGVACRPGCIDIAVTDCMAHDNGSSGMQFIRSNNVVVTGGSGYRNGPDSSTEGDGLDMQGCWDSMFVGMTAWGNSRSGIYITETSEGGSGWTWTGNWSASTSTYVRGQVAFYNGQAYVALQAVPTGQPPESSNTDPYWLVCPYDNQTNPRLSQNIQCVDLVANRNFVYAARGLYSSSASYQFIDSVRFAGDIYTDNNPAQFITNEVPSTTVALASNGVDVSTFAGSGVLNVATTTGFDSSGYVWANTANGYAKITYTGTSGGNQFTGCTTVSGAQTTSGALATGGTVINHNYWSIQTTGGASLSIGCSVAYTTGIAFRGCEFNYNGDTNQGIGFQVQQSVTGLSLQACRGIGNPVACFQAANLDATTNSPISLQGCVFDGNGISTNAAYIVQSCQIVGGLYGNSTQQGIQLDTSRIGTTIPAEYIIQDVFLPNTATSLYPSIQVNTTPASGNAYVTVQNCTMPNSAWGNFYCELAPTGTTVSYLDGNGIGTVSRATITDLNVNNKFGGSKSFVGRNNYALPGSSGVRGSNSSLAQTGNYTLLTIDDTVVFTISGATTATLPTASNTPSKRFTVVNANASSSSLTLAAAGGSIPTTTIAAGTAVTVVSDGTNWQRAA